MIQQFEQLENAISRLEGLVSELKREKDRLTRETAELRGIIEDRDLEILQLQEDAQKKSESVGSEKREIESRIEGLLGRVRAIAPDENQ